MREPVQDGQEPIGETGMGPRNAERVLEFATDDAKGRRLHLTTRHVHPVHAFGARCFAGEATCRVKRDQAGDLKVKDPHYLWMFRGLGEPVAHSGGSPAYAVTRQDDGSLILHQNRAEGLDGLQMQLTRMGVRAVALEADENCAEGHPGKGT